VSLHNTPSRRVLVTGLGVLSPIGLTVAEVLSSLRETRSGIRAWDLPTLEKQLPAGLIERDFSDQFTKADLPYLDRCSQLAVLAAAQAARDAGIEQFGALGQRAGLYFGTVAGGVATEHAWVRQFQAGTKPNPRPYTIMACMLNAAPAHISIRHQILGPVMTHSSACTSSGTAIGDAFRAIRDGYLDVALAGGAEACILETFVIPWGGLRALAEPDPDDVSRSCKPFSIHRSGLVLGEGAAFLLLESEEHALARGALPYCTMGGYGIASDGYHIGSPKVDGQIAALSSALADARLAPSDVDYVNAHATATGGGDPIEAMALRTVFGHQPAVSATKAIHGHLLGAASAIELLVTILALHQGFLPATAHLDQVDPACELNHVIGTPKFGMALRHALSLSAGFGGTNTALIVSQAVNLTRKPFVARI
jgi:3-oxoacyl-[acyl-carrier-protein] synthase II